MRRSTTLPTVRGLDLLVRWANEGPSSLAPPPCGHDNGRRNDGRTFVMDRLRRLASGLQVDPEFTRELRPVRDRDFGDLSPSLLNELAWRARSRGYVTAGCRERVPLSPVQADTLHRLMWGCTQEEIARETGCLDTGVAGALKRARTTHGCHTNAQLVACAHRNGWWPDHHELGILLSGRMVWGDYGLRSTPPYTWKDNG